jgi:hypothetical protein
VKLLGLFYERMPATEDDLAEYPEDELVDQPPDGFTVTTEVRDAFWPLTGYVAALFAILAFNAHWFGVTAVARVLGGLAAVFAVCTAALFRGRR